MTEWAVVGVIVVLIGLIASVVKPVITLNTTLTKLTVVVDSLEKRMNEIFDDRKTCQTEWHQKNEEQDLKLQDHENRITHLEDAVKD